MPAPASIHACGPLHWTVLRHRHGEPAEPLARGWLAGTLGLAVDALGLERDARNRPRFDAASPGLDCNWSHSGERLLVALGHGYAVGADLERRRPRARALALAERFFAREEFEWLSTLPASVREDAFVRLWCAKEAVLKAHGHGLSFGLQRLCFEARAGALRLVACDPELGAPEDWGLRVFEPEHGYVAALAWHPLRAAAVAA